MLSSKASAAVCGKDRAPTMHAFTDWLNEWVGGWMNGWPMTSKGLPPFSRDLWNLPYALSLMRFPAAFLRWRASRFLLFWTKAGSPGCPPLMRGHSPRGLRLQANYFRAVLATGFKPCRLLLVSYILPQSPLSTSKGTVPWPNGLALSRSAWQQT